MSDLPGNSNPRYELLIAGGFFAVIALVLGYRLVSIAFLEQDELKQSSESLSINEGANDTQFVRPIESSTPPASDRDETEAEFQILPEFKDSQGNLVIPPPVHQEIPDSLLEGIPQVEPYVKVPLEQVATTYTESEFQQERADWYENQFLLEYSQQGHHDEAWNEQAVEFLKESARRVSILRYRKLRLSRFYHDEFNKDHAAQGYELINSGCRDQLVLAMLIQELVWQGQHTEAKKLANQLRSQFHESNSGYINYEIVRQLMRSDSALQDRQRLPRFLLSAFLQCDGDTTHRRILHEEAQFMFAPAHQLVFVEFFAMLESHSKLDHWLKHMVIGELHEKLSTDAGTLRQMWPGYNLLDEVAALKLHREHRHRAYQSFLEARLIDRQSPETLSKLFRMSFPLMPSGMSFEYTSGVLPPESPVNPRYWFDEVVSMQIDYRPIYREMRWSMLRALPSRDFDWSDYGTLVAFGEECLATERFDTQVPFEFHQAVQAIVRHDEYSIPPASPRNRLVYSREGLIDKFAMLRNGYSDILNEKSVDYFDSLLAGMHWIRGERELASQKIDQLATIDQNAFAELYLDTFEILRELAQPESPFQRRFRAQAVSSLAVCSQRDELLVSLTDGTVSKWNIGFDRELGDNAGIEDNAVSLTYSFSPDGQYLGSYVHPTLSIQSTEAFELIGSLVMEEEVRAFGISNSGTLAAVVTGNALGVWDVLQKKQIGTAKLSEEISNWGGIDWQTQLREVRNITFSANDKVIAFVQGAEFEPFPQGSSWSPENAPNLTNRCFVYDIPSGRLVYEGRPFLPNITGIGFGDSDGEILIAGSSWSLYQAEPRENPQIVEEHFIQRLGLKDAGIIQTYHGRDEPLRSPIVFGNDGATVVALSESEVLVWEKETGREFASVLPLAGNLTQLAASRSSNQLVVLDDEGSVATIPGQFTLGRRPVLAKPEEFGNLSPQRLVLDQQHEQLVVCNDKAGGICWKFGEDVHGMLYRYPGPIGARALDFAPQTQLLATTADLMPRTALRKLPKSYPVFIFNVETFRAERALTGETSQINCARFDPSGRFLFAGQQDGNIALWDLELEGDSPIRILKENATSVDALEFSPDGRMLLVGSRRGEAFGKKVLPGVNIWQVDDLSTAQLQLTKTIELTRKTPYPFNVLDVEASSDGEWILVSDDALTTLFTAAGRIQCEVPGRRARFHPDGTRFVTTGGNGMINQIAAWNMNGERLKVYDGGHRRPISSLELTADGKFILSASYSEGVVVRRVDDGSPVPFLSDLFGH
ncbi:MAG: hypothetical protein R3C18_26120 [Planctomycetaceae bacterium]